MSSLLLTASINAQLASPIYTKLIDTEERLRQYISTLRMYIEQSDFDIFIWCENTGYNIAKIEELRPIAEKNNKILEILSFTADVQNVRRLGKGYGEGQCIEYAINNSKYLSHDEDVFYKVTGRLYIKNANKIIKQTRNSMNCFYTQGLTKPYIETVFFKSQIEFFKNNLCSVYKHVNDSQGTFLESLYFTNLISSVEPISNLSPYPHIIGNSGSTGENYLKKDIRILNLKSLCGYFSVNKTFYRIYCKLKNRIFYKK